MHFCNEAEQFWHELENWRYYTLNAAIIFYETRQKINKNK